MRRLLIVLLGLAGCRSAPPSTPAPAAQWQTTASESSFGLTIHRRGQGRLLHLQTDDDICSWAGLWPTRLDATPEIRLPQAWRTQVRNQGIGVTWQARRGSGLLLLEAPAASLAAALSTLEAAGWPAPLVAVVEGKIDPIALPLMPAVQTVETVATSSLSRGGGVWRARQKSAEDVRALEVLAHIIAERTSAQLEPQEGLRVSTSVGIRDVELRLALISTSTDVARVSRLGQAALKDIAQGKLSIAEFEAARERVTGNLRRRLNRTGPRALLLAETLLLDDALFGAQPEAVERLQVEQVRRWAQRWAEARP